ncbi:sensor histidine kinase [Pelomonas sp. KK5]|uniref:sensor histidine kinase n=1 Tax=Pelomonas sp. KK5 TaxID=1855730 RepID=UPI00097C7E5E|nr:ATP-binding protein [Pelomonas sp. KK5]
MQRPLPAALAPTLLLAWALPARAEEVSTSFAGQVAAQLLHSAPGWLAAMLLMMTVTTALLALTHRRERRVFFLCGMMFSWVLLQGQNGIERPALALAIQALMVLCGVQFLLRTVLWTRFWLDLTLLLQVVLAPLSLRLLAEAGAPDVLSRAWQTLMLLELLAAFAMHLWLRWRALNEVMPADPLEIRDFRLMSVLMGCAAPALLAQHVLMLGSGDGLLPGWLSLALPLLMLGLALHVVMVFARAAVDSETHHALLEQRMHERIADAERNFHAMAELKLEQVTERERKRIAADLHDDLGAKLLTIVHTSESDRISSLAREALEEMRLSVRGLTGKPVQLLDALGDWRAELVSRLAQANIQAEWKSPPEDIVHTLPARAYVQTTRIFREAVSNIIKHSGATHCTIGCQVQDGDFLVVIQDDGQGIPAELDGRLDRGHGMASMKSRAKQMHGQCLVESGPGWGTVIRLTIPL